MYLHHLVFVKMLLFLKVSNVFNVVKIQFVMNKKGLVGVIVVVGILLVVGFFWFVREADEGGVEVGAECDFDADCVPASCCHATECVLKSEAPNCSGMFCTAVCAGPLDCGAGKCDCVNESCEVVSNE